MKLQTLNILHSISCFLFLRLIWRKKEKKGQSKPVVLRRSQKFYTASRSPSPPWPLGPFAWTLIWANFQEAGTFCQSTTVVPTSQSVSCFSPSFFSVHFILGSVVVDPTPILRTLEACWVHTLDETSVHHSSHARTFMWKNSNSDCAFPELNSVHSASRWGCWEKPSWAPVGKTSQGMG